MKSKFDGSKCPECQQKIALNVEITKNSKGQWCHDTCVNGKKETVANLEDKEKAELESKARPDKFGAEKEVCIAYAAFCKTIDYPKELWNLSAVWNTERIRRK